MDLQDLMSFDAKLADKLIKVPSTYLPLVSGLLKLAARILCSLKRRPKKQLMI